ncbi:MAG: hypothetical protein J4O03_09675 [Chloroflexi bacterium]|nr:hypothetical protein [Chloroflexota bacterium]MCI0878591.1 hypothetical protein [Chloroflexota bacterium]
MVKRLRRGLLSALLALLLVTAGNSDFRPSTVDLTISPYKYSLVRWEVSNFMDKWVRQVWTLLPWNPKVDRERRNALAQEFFTLGQQAAELERQLGIPSTGSGSLLSEDEARSARSEVLRVAQRRSKIRPLVEQAIEAEISAVLAQEGFASRIGFIFPPVDTVFTSSPGVLVLSPRERIFRQKTVLLAPGIGDEERNRIEDRLFFEENLSALVEDTGGVAVYPSVVSDSGRLHHAVVIAAHEWLHHWFFFHSLGQHFWDSSDMTTLNETAATIGGEEIGDRAFTAMTGETVVRDSNASGPQDPDAFDYDKAMRQTRMRTEELLGQGKILEAEAYMEERRQTMVANGFLIRKINQAFFAFHGSYAANPASISPINDQLKELRNRSASLEEFLNTVAGFGSYREFLDHLELGRE